MTTYAQKLELVKQYTLLTEKQFAGYGGAFYAEEMGLHVGQDSTRDDDIGGVVPFSWQVEYCRKNGSIALIKRLFVDMGWTYSIEDYEKENECT